MSFDDIPDQKQILHFVSQASGMRNIISCGGNNTNSIGQFGSYLSPDLYGTPKGLRLPRSCIHKGTLIFEYVKHLTSDHPNIEVTFTDMYTNGWMIDVCCYPEGLNRSG